MEVDVEIQRRLDVALDAARRTGRVLLDGPRDQATVQRAEQTLDATLCARFDEDGWDENSDDREFSWIVAAVAGQDAFEAGLPFFGTLLGLKRQDRFVMSVVNAPALAHAYHAIVEKGAFRDGLPIHVSDVDRHDQAQLLYPDFKRLERAGLTDAYLALAGKVGRTRGFGGFWGFLLVAQGSAEIMIEPQASPTLEALTPIVTEAGGRVDRLPTNDPGRPTLIATSSAKMMDLLTPPLRGNQ